MAKDDMLEPGMPSTGTCSNMIIWWQNVLNKGDTLINKDAKRSLIIKRWWKNKDAKRSLVVEC